MLCRLTVSEWKESFVPYALEAMRCMNCICSLCDRTIRLRIRILEPNRRQQRLPQKYRRKISIEKGLCECGWIDITYGIDARLPINQIRVRLLSFSTTPPLPSLSPPSKAIDEIELNMYFLLFLFKMANALPIAQECEISGWNSIDEWIRMTKFSVADSERTTRKCVYDRNGEPCRDKMAKL